MASTIVEWFRALGPNAQRGMPAPLSPWQAQGPDASGEGPVAPASPTQRRVKYTQPRQWFGTPATKQRGEPVPFSPADHRPIENVEFRVPYGAPVYQRLRRYDWGSAGFSFDSGRLFSNPIGAGVVALHRIKPFSSAVAQVVPGQGIFWNSQTIADFAGPELGTLYDPQTLYALLGNTNAQAVAAPPGSMISAGLLAVTPTVQNAQAQGPELRKNAANNFLAALGLTAPRKAGNG